MDCQSSRNGHGSAPYLVAQSDSSAVWRVIFRRRRTVSSNQRQTKRSDVYGTN